MRDVGAVPPRVPLPGVRADADFVSDLPSHAYEPRAALPLRSDFDGHNIEADLIPGQRVAWWSHVVSCV